MNPFKKVAFHTLGCKLNFSETSTIAREFQEHGYAKVELEDTPDVFVLNTCSVTENADKKCQGFIKKSKKINPNGFVVVIGCYAQLKPDEIADIPGVDLVLGAQEKFNIIEHIEKKDILKEAQYISGNIKDVNEFVPSYSFGDRTRTFLKIQDGCDYFCTFCTIPLARGKSRNANIDDTVKEAQKVAATNVKEIVLTGVNIGDFGQGDNDNFYQLIQQFDHVEGIDRFRISSIEPNLLSDEIISFVATSNKFVPHFHIPLQSGSDFLLKKMRRKYEVALYSERIKKIKSLMPNACIGVDVIVGFPGETDEEFMKTYDYLKELDISYLHVFTYSERANTGALKMEQVVPMKTRKERSKMLRILSAKKKRAFYESQVGNTGTVLWESDNNEGCIYGFTENYVKVKRTYDKSLTNTTQLVELKTIDRDGLMKVDILESIKK